MCRRVCVCTLLSGFWKQRAELRSSPKPKAAQSWVGLFVSCCTCEAYIYKINAVQIHTWGFTYGGAYIISAAREAIRDGAFVSVRGDLPLAGSSHTSHICANTTNVIGHHVHKLNRTHKLMRRMMRCTHSNSIIADIIYVILSLALSWHKLSRYDYRNVLFVLVDVSADARGMRIAIVYICYKVCDVMCETVNSSKQNRLLRDSPKHVTHVIHHTYCAHCYIDYSRTRAHTLSLAVWVRGNHKHTRTHSPAHTFFLYVKRRTHSRKQNKKHTDPIEYLKTDLHKH